MNDDSPGKLIERALGELGQAGKRARRDDPAPDDLAQPGSAVSSGDEPSSPTPGRRVSLEEALQTIEKRQAMAADNLPSDGSAQAAQGLEQLLVRFEIGKTALAVPMLQVLEIAERPTATRVPGLSSYFPGVINLRGEIVVLFDLPAYMKQDSAADDCSLLVVHDENQPIAGVLVDAVHGIAPYPQATLRKPGVAAEHALNRVEIGNLEFGERYYSVVDLLALLRSSQIATELGIDS